MAKPTSKYQIKADTSSQQTKITQSQSKAATNPYEELLKKSNNQVKSPNNGSVLDSLAYQKALANQQVTQSAYDNYNSLQQQAKQSKAELYGSKLQASKYAETLLKSQGLNNQGVALNRNVANSNAYLNALSGIDQSKNTSMAEIYKNYLAGQNNLTNYDTQIANQRQNESSNWISLFSNVLGNATTLEDLDKEYNNLDLSKLSEYDKYALATQYNQQKKALENYKSLSDYQVTDTTNAYQNPMDIIYSLNKSNRYDPSYYEVLFKNYNIPNGTVINMKYDGKEDKNNYVYINGSWYPTNKNGIPIKEIINSINTIDGNIKGFSEYEGQLRQSLASLGITKK